MKPIEFLKEHCEFNDRNDCYVMLAVSRKKDTPEFTQSKEIVFREVIKREEDIVRKYNKIKAMMISYKCEENKSYPFYLYISLNARNAKKATYHLMNKINLWFYDETIGTDHSRMFKKIYGHFYSELTKPHSRSNHTKYFMIDYDIKKGITDFAISLIEKEIEVVFIQETRNGYHIKTMPFDRRILPDTDDYSVTIDRQIFVDYIENKEE